MINAGYDKTPAVASDHPTLASRVQAANKRAQQLSAQSMKYRQPEIATPDQFTRYKQLANEAAKNIPDDQKVLKTQNLLQALPRSCWVPFDPNDRKQAEQRIVNDAQRGQKNSGQQG